MLFYLFYICLFLFISSERGIASHVKLPYYQEENLRELYDEDFDKHASCLVPPCKKTDPLYHAIMKNDISSFNVALDESGQYELKFRNYPRNETLAHVVLAHNRSFEMFEKIVKKSMDCNVIMEKQSKFVRFIDAQTHNGATALDYAVSYQKRAEIIFLHQCHADFQKINKDGKTPLELALKLEKDAKARLQALETKEFSRFGGTITIEDVQRRTDIVATVRACTEESQTSAHAIIYHPWRRNKRVVDLTLLTSWPKNGY